MAPIESPAYAAESTSRVHRVGRTLLVCPIYFNERDLSEEELVENTE